MSEWWIEEPKVLGSSNPDTPRLKELFREGFRTVISLLDETEQQPGYEINDILALGYSRHSIPVKAFHPPTLAQMLQFLATLEPALRQGNVIVHCQGGSGRTGTMGAAYLIQQGWGPTEAINTIRGARPGAIETAQQEECLWQLFHRLHGQQSCTS